MFIETPGLEPWGFYLCQIEQAVALDENLADAALLKRLRRV
jgi:hypothetical protein